MTGHELIPSAACWLSKPMGVIRMANDKQSSGMLVDRSWLLFALTIAVRYRNFGKSGVMAETCRRKSGLEAVSKPPPLQTRPLEPKGLFGVVTSKSRT